MAEYLHLLIVVAAAGSVLAGLILFLWYRELWQRAQIARAGLSFPRMVLLQRRGTPVRVLLDAYTRTRHARIDVPFDRYLELHRRGGNVTRVSMALVTAHAAGLAHTFEELADIELHKQDAFDYVQNELAARREERRREIPRRYAY